MGRPSIYSVELADRIAVKLEDGQSMRAICAEDEMPSRDTVRLWMAEKPDFQAKCARAREEQAEFHHDETDRIERAIEAGDLNPQAGSVILASKRWRMEKLKPKVYGAKLAVAGDPDAPLTVRILDV